MLTDPHMPLALRAGLIVALGLLVGCQGVDGPPGGDYGARGGWSDPGPRTAFPDVEVYSEDPVLAFQRTGKTPPPVAILTVGTPVQPQGSSGPFTLIRWGGRQGWVRTTSLAGLTGYVGPDTPDPLVEPDRPTGMPGGPDLPTDRHDVIDLDRLP